MTSAPGFKRRARDVCPLWKDWVTTAHALSGWVPGWPGHPAGDCWWTAGRRRRGHMLPSPHGSRGARSRGRLRPRADPARGLPARRAAGGGAAGRDRVCVRAAGGGRAAAQRDAQGAALARGAARRAPRPPAMRHCLAAAMTRGRAVSFWHQQAAQRASTSFSECHDTPNQTATRAVTLTWCASVTQELHIACGSWCAVRCEAGALRGAGVWRAGARRGCRGAGRRGGRGAQAAALCAQHAAGRGHARRPQADGEAARRTPPAVHMLALPRPVASLQIPGAPAGRAVPLPA